MSSDDLQSVVAALQFYNYIALVVPTACIYDYIITLPEEIEYVWNKSWGFVSVMFLIVRYVGLIVAVLNGIYGTIFIPGPILVRTVLLLVEVWGFTIFLAASNIVMILRVYAMYNKSKLVLGVLLVLYASELVIFSMSAAYYNNPNTYLTMTNPQVLDMSFCNPTYTYPSTSHLGIYKYIPRITLAALLCILAVTRICIDSFQAYKVTKRWHVNRYIDLLAREGVIYFVSHIFYIATGFGQTTPDVIMNVIATVFMFVLSPRFILNVRGLYMSNFVHTGLDSGFGIGKTRPSQLLASTVGFADSESAFGTTNSGDVEMHAVGSRK